jgi:imidazolonepropionase
VSKAKPQVFKNIGCLLTLAGVSAKQGRKPTEADLGIIENAAIVSLDGKIAWVGPQKKLPKEFARKSKEIDLDKATVLPGFVECHTHLVFAGDRSQEFEWRNQGVSYQEIAKRGGGILSTMKATRAIKSAQLKNISQQRVDQFLSQGVTTLEIKSGYGLNLESELKCLKVAKSLQGPEIVTTFLGAHAKPPEFEKYEDYLDHLIEEVLPVIKKQKISNRVDIFIENGFFEKAASRDYLKKAKDLGFQITIHADQLSLSGGTELALELNALSADHVIQIDPMLINKIAKSKTVAVLLPAADLYMKCAYPKARELIDAGARVALSTDFNPGTSPTQDLALVGLLARLEMKMTLAEAITAYTFNAAAALALENKIGSLEVGKSANFISIKNDWNQLFYSAGAMQSELVFIKGEMRHKY